MRRPQIAESGARLVSNLRVATGVDHYPSYSDGEFMILMQQINKE